MRPFEPMSGKSKYEAIVDIIDDFYADFKDQGYLDRSCINEYKMIIQIYNSYKKKVESEKDIPKDELDGMMSLIEKVEKIKPEADRLLAMKCFW
jgi:hypothetical protein